MTWTDVADTVVTAGATEAIAASILAFAQPGEEVITFEPFYDAYAAVIGLAGGVRRKEAPQGAGGGIRPQDADRPVVDDEGMRVHLEELARDRADHLLRRHGGVDGNAATQHLGREDGVADILQGSQGAREGREELGHIRSSMSSASVSASGPTTTWIIVPTFVLLTVTMLLLTFIGDALRDAFDTRKS